MKGRAHLAPDFAPTYRHLSLPAAENPSAMTPTFAVRAPFNQAYLMGGNDYRQSGERPSALPGITRNADNRWHIGGHSPGSDAG